MPVENQVAIIYAATNGHLDDVPVQHVRRWEEEFHEFLAAQHGKVLEAIRTKKALDDATASGLKTAIEAFKKLFSAD